MELFYRSNQYDLLIEWKPYCKCHQYVTFKTFYSKKNTFAHTHLSHYYIIMKTFKTL